MRIPKRITSRWLRGHYACKDQRDKFKKVFPQGVVLTVQALVLARKKWLYTTWLAQEILKHTNSSSTCWCQGTKQSNLNLLKKKLKEREK